MIAIEVPTPLFLPRSFLTFAYDGVLREAPLGREAEPAAADQQRPVRTSRRKRSAARTETSPQRYSSQFIIRSNVPRKRSSAHDFCRGKNARRTAGVEVANPTSTSQAPAPGLEGEASARREPDIPPTEDADRLSTTKSEVESALNHRRRRTVFHDACFSPEALNAFNAGDPHLHAAQDGFTRATEQYVKDIRVREFNSCICQ